MKVSPTKWEISEAANMLRLICASCHNSEIAKLESNNVDTQMSDDCVLEKTIIMRILNLPLL